MRHFRLLVAAAALFLGAQAIGHAAEHTFTIGTESFLLDGKPFSIRCGEIHFARVPKEYWRQRLQMCHAMGLNAVCVYLFWNFHEETEGNFDWSGDRDVREFCKIAQEEGLWVLLRPGPYSCAEWEMGGLPWWLLNKEGIQLRSTDPSFLEPAKRYLREVARVLGPLQVTHGGPILMAQVENEYGLYGEDPAYMGALRQAMIDGGFDIPLFACGPMEALPHGYRPDLFEVVNFGAGKPEKAFAALSKFQTSGPLMNGEYYPGWFDCWGRAHAKGAIPPYLTDLEYMLKNHRSFSIYMAHGGTTFGFWAGADSGNGKPYQPDTSSYDYDAPISEAGWVTDKFTQTRALMAKYLLPGEALAPIPAPIPVAAIPQFTFTHAAPVFRNLPKPIHDTAAHTFEAYEQPHGCIVYEAKLPAGPAGTLAMEAVHDFAWAYLDGKPIGVLDRRSGDHSLPVPAREKPATLRLLVEAMGRINFSKAMFDHKGLIGPVTWTEEGAGPSDLHDWSIYRMPLDGDELEHLTYYSRPASGPAFWRAEVKLGSKADTFLDLRSWGKGVVWVNGHCLGRFWNLGPTQTMYCPGVWLQKGVNEVVVLDLLGPKAPVMQGLTTPILDEQHPEASLTVAAR